MSGLSTDTFSYDKISDEQLEKYAEKYYSAYGYDHDKVKRKMKSYFTILYMAKKNHPLPIW